MVVKNIFQSQFSPLTPIADDDPFHWSRILGIEKNSSDSYYDLILLLAVFFHRCLISIINYEILVNAIIFKTFFFFNTRDKEGIFLVILRINIIHILFRIMFNDLQQATVFLLPPWHYLFPRCILTNSTLTK